MWKKRRATRAEKDGSTNEVRTEYTAPGLTEPARRIQVSILENAQEEIDTTGTLSPDTYAAVLPL